MAVVRPGVGTRTLSDGRVVQVRDRRIGSARPSATSNKAVASASAAAAQAHGCWQPRYDPYGDLSGYVPSARPEDAVQPDDDDSGRSRPLCTLDEALAAAGRSPERTVVEETWERTPSGGYRCVEKPVGTELTGPAFLSTHEPSRVSGHKLHVAAGTVDDVADVARRLWPVAEEYGLGMKIMTPKGLAATGAAKGKGVTVYLTGRATLDRDTAAVAAALDGYETDATVEGDTPVVGHVYHRFELSHDPGHEVGGREYHRLYRRA